MNEITCCGLLNQKICKIFDLNVNYTFNKTISVFLTLILVFSQQGLAQLVKSRTDIFVDSIKARLLTVKQDTEIVKLNYLIGTSLKIQRQGYWDSILERSNRTGNLLFQTRMLSVVANMLRQSGNVPLAMNYLNKAEKLAASTGSKYELILICRGIAFCHMNGSNPKKALDYSYKALKLAEELDNKKFIVKQYSYIGVVHFYMNRFEKALEFHFKGLDLARKYKFNYDIAWVLVAIGTDYASLKDHPKASYYYLESLKYVNEISDGFLLGNIYNSAGSGYQMRKQYDSALYCYTKAYEIFEKSNDRINMVSSLVQLSSLNLATNKPKKAKEFALEALDLANATGFSSQIPNLADLLKDIYVKEGNYKEALAAYTLSIKTRDSLASTKNQNEADEIEFKHNLEKKENQNRLLAQKNQIQDLKITQNRNLLYTLSALFSLALLIVILFIRQSRFKSERQSIQLQQKLLRSQMDPHFIFNALNSVNQLILTNENEKAQSYLTKFSALIRRLLESSTTEMISIKEEMIILEKYLEIESLRFNSVFSYSIVAAENCDAANTDIPHFLIQPFVENAIWHGLLPKQGEKHISVTFEKKNENTIKCIIEDNGVGRSKEVTEAATGKESKRSLAITFIKQRLAILGKMKRINCGVEIVDNTDNNGTALGTKVIVTIPILKY